MFSIHGQVVNTFFTPASEKYPEPSYKVQLLGDHVTKDGQCRKEMLDLTIPFEIYSSLQGCVGKPVRLPVGLFVSDKGAIRAFFPKGMSKDTLNKDIIEASN